MSAVGKMIKNNWWYGFWAGWTANALVNMAYSDTLGKEAYIQAINDGWITPWEARWTYALGFLAIVGLATMRDKIVEIVNKTVAEAKVVTNPGSANPR